jgi:hypothetical protein
MLRRLSAVLIATALVAGPALVTGYPAQAAGAMPAAANAATPADGNTKPVGKSTEAIKHRRKHLARHRVGHNELSRHSKLTAKTNRHRIARHVVKPGKATKTTKDSKATKTSKTTKPGANTHG